MPKTRSALVRYRIIDSCISSFRNQCPDLEYIQERIEDELGYTVSKFTIYKDFAEMGSIYNCQIVYNRKRRGYQYTQEGFSIREFPLTTEEIEALDFSTAMLNLFKGTKMFENYEAAINKVIEGYRISKEAGISETDIIQTEEPIKNNGSEWIHTCIQAIIKNKELHIEYLPFGRITTSIHLIEPYMVKEYRNRWYLVGKTHNIIILAFDRIKNITETGELFTPDPTFSPSKYFKYSFGITQRNDADPEKVILSFTPYQAQYIISQPLHHSQKLLVENSEEVQIQLEVYLTAELTMTILGYGDQVKVIAPEELRNRVYEVAKKVASFYVLETDTTSSDLLRENAAP